MNLYLKFRLQISESDYGPIDVTAFHEEWFDIGIHIHTLKYIEIQTALSTVNICPINVKLDDGQFYNTGCH
jgi:hypothetical protein